MVESHFSQMPKNFEEEQWNKNNLPKFTPGNYLMIDD